MLTIYKKNSTLYLVERIQIGGIFMVSINTYKQILKNHRNPCFIANFADNCVIYCNREMKKLLRSDKDAIGVPYYKVIKDSGEKVDSKPILNWNSDTIKQQRLYDETLQKNFLLTYTAVHDAEKKILLLEYAVLETEDEKPIHFQLAERISLLDIDPESKVKALLHMLGEAYNGSCSYVHLINHTEKTIKMKASWLKHTITDTSDYLIEDVEDMAGFDGLIFWGNARNADGVWDCDINRENSPQQALDKLALAVFKRKNLILCGVNDENGDLKLTICIGDCEHLEVNHALLKYVTQLIEDALKK